MKLIYTRTSDGLELPGFYFAGADICVITVHGMSGSYLENRFGNELGESLAGEGHGYIFSHNRGYGHINDIKTFRDDGSFEYTRCGATYELFEDSEKDIGAWLETARAMGYKKIVLMGHSLGCNKVINYMYKYQPADVSGVILASPPDMIGLMKSEEHQPDYEAKLAEAQSMIAQGNPRGIIQTKVWDWYDLSAQTFVSLSDEDGGVNNLPIWKNPVEFTQLASISQPILGIMGEFDDIAIGSVLEDIELVKERASSARLFEVAVIGGSDHSYNGMERELSAVIREWLTTSVS